MLQFIKKISWILLLAAGLQTSWAFSLLGPFPGFVDYTPATLPASFGDTWQVSVIGYGYPGSADIGGPKNLGEGYRRNAQVYYYACDANFLGFFGSNGVVAVDQAFTILNTTLTNVDAFSASLAEFPLNSQAINFDASALGLADLKSLTLGTVVEQMGLADPIRFAWTLHDRWLPAGLQCPAYNYLVVQRNFDITASPLNQIQYSPYVNGTLYSYFLREVCPASVPDPQAVTFPVQVDPLQNIFGPVASIAGGNGVILGGAQINPGLQSGGFYTGLTRDDVAGLRYLYSTNNLAFEPPATGSVLVNSSGPGGTNYGAPFVLYTSNYTAFALSAKTNDPVTLSNLYPGLIITSSSQNFSVQNVTNGYISYATNLIGAPAGSQKLVVVPVVTPTLVTTYVDTFANVVIPAGSKTNKSSTGLLLTTQVESLIGAPGGNLVTNTTAKKVTLADVPSGDYFINTNPCGPPLIVGTLYTNIVATTNLIVVASNTAGLFYSQSLVTYETNHWYVAEPILCGAVAGGTTTNVPGLFEGIGGVQFVKSTYDSLIGQFYQPITNTYTQIVIVNSKAVKQTFQRVALFPDFLLSAQDLASGPNSAVHGSGDLARSINFNISNISTNLAGPGTIDQPCSISFNKAGIVYLNLANSSQASGSLLTALGSFDGSTNPPVVYPDGTSINNLANQVLVQITPSSLPDGTNGVAYPPTTFVATGGAFSPPFTWSLPSGGLPSGLTLSAGGTISGTPTQSGTFDFTVQLTDSLSRVVTWSYPITIH